MPHDIRPHPFIPEQPPDPPAIRGLGSTTAAFLGLAHDGPIGIPSHPLASLNEFTALYGDGQTLSVRGLTVPAYLWHAARAFFAEGGRRLYIVRVAHNTRLPTSDHYAGLPAGTGPATGLVALEAIDSIATVAAPGATAAIMNVQTSAGTSVAAALIAHTEAMRFRFAILDSGDQDTLDHVLARRSVLNSSFAALYYPWPTVDDPASTTPLPLPPSGFVAGILARNDSTYGIAHAPPTKQFYPPAALPSRSRQKPRPSSTPPALAPSVLSPAAASGSGAHAPSRTIRNGNTSTSAAPSFTWSLPSRKAPNGSSSSPTAPLSGPQSAPPSPTSSPPNGSTAH